MGSTHAAAYTHRNNNVLSTTTLTFDQRVACGTSTGHAVWVTHRNSTTVNVVDFWVDTQLVATVKHLTSKSFVQFPKADVVDGQAVLLQQLRNGIDWANTHFFWLVTHNHHATVDT